MARDWETWLSNSTGPASATEQEDRDRTEKRIADAVARDSFLGGNVLSRPRFTGHFCGERDDHATST
jgi:hypothetical protein